MIKIDEILKMLSTDNPKEIQEKGIELGKQVETLDCFIMPYYEGESEKLWENCAKIITSQPIEKRKRYIFRLLEWVKDMSTPGAQEIYNWILECSPFTYKTRLIYDIEWQIEEFANLADKKYLNNLTNLKNKIEKNIKLEEIDIDVIKKNIQSFNEEENTYGVEEGKKIKHLEAFIMKYNSHIPEKTWENYAKIICSKTDEELKPYLNKLLYVIENLEREGSKLIFERLVRIKGKWLDKELENMLYITKELNKTNLYSSLLKLKTRRV